MSEQPFMQLYVADYLGDTRHLTTEQHGAYLLLLMTMWRSGGHLPNDPAKLARIAGVSARRWHLIAQDVMDFFTELDGQVTQKRLQREHQKAVSKSEKRSVSGRAGGFAKSLKSNETTLAIATVLPQHSSEPEVRKKKEEPNGSSKSRGSRLPDDWQPDREFARKEGLAESQIGREADRFRDHWRSQSGARGVKKDWMAAWNNWVRNAVDGFGRREKPKMAVNGYPANADKNGNLPGDPWYGVDY